MKDKGSPEAQPEVIGRDQPNSLKRLTPPGPLPGVTLVDILGVEGANEAIEEAREAKKTTIRLHAARRWQLANRRK